MDPITSEFDRLPPHSIDAEMCTLCSMLVAPKDTGTIALVKGIVGSDDWFRADHQIIFDTIIEMDLAGKSIDLVLLCNELDARQLLEEIGGRAYIGKISMVMPSYAHAEHYAKIVKEKSLWRQAIAKSNDILRAAYSPSYIGDAAGAIASYSATFAEIAVKGCSASIQHISAAMAEVVNVPDEPDGIASGISDLDKVIGVLPFGQFVLVGGRPGMGKSQLLKQAILNIASTGVPCGLVSIEEGGRKIAQNILANLSGVENHKIAFRRLEDHDKDALKSGFSRGASLPFFFDETSSRISEVESSITRMVLKHRCKFIAVDFIQLIDSETEGENENREITVISNALKRIFKRLKVANMVAAQLNRGGDNREVRKPNLKDLRGSGTLEQNADIVILLHRDDYYRQNDTPFIPTHQIQAIIAKHKSNGQAVVPLHFSGPYQRITNWNSGKGIDPNAVQTQFPFDANDQAAQDFDDKF